MHMLSPRIGADLDAILDAVSGDPDVVGAIAAMNPQLGAAIMQAQSKRRAIVGSPEEGRPLNTQLPMTNGNSAVAAGASVSLTATPLRNFKPNGLVIQFDGVAVTVDTVTIANIPQLGSNAGVVAADVYKRDAVLPYELDWQVIPANQSLIATCTNRHAATASAIFGAVFGKYTLGL